MPVYEYRCNQCGEVFEKMVRFSEIDRTPLCPKCASPDTRKKVSAVATLGSSSASGGSASSSGCGSRGGFS